MWSPRRFLRTYFPEEPLGAVMQERATELFGMQLAARERQSLLRTLLELDVPNLPPQELDLPGPSTTILGSERRRKLARKLQPFHHIVVHLQKGGCCQLPLCNGYRPCFKTWGRIRYFEGLSILRAGGRRACNRRGCKVLAKPPARDFEALRGCPAFWERLKAAGLQLCSSEGCCAVAVLL